MSFGSADGSPVDTSCWQLSTTRTEVLWRVVGSTIGIRRWRLKCVAFFSGMPAPDCGFYYSANSFSKPEAKALYANPSRLTFVDAVVLPCPLPGPRLRVSVASQSQATIICFGFCRGRVCRRPAEHQQGAYQSWGATGEGIRRPSYFACRER